MEYYENENMPQLGDCRQGREQRKYIRKDFSRIGWGLLAMLLGSQTLGAVLVAVPAYFWPAFGQSHWFTWCMLLAPLYVVGLPLFLLVTRKLPAQPAQQQYRISPKTWLMLLVVCFGAMYFFNYISVMCNAFFSFLKGSSVENPLDSMSNLPVFWTIVFVGIVGPIMEELVFRGLVIAKLRHNGEGACVFTSALTFALFHGNLSQMLYAFALGAIFAFITVKTGRLRYSMALHISVNVMGMVVVPNLVEFSDITAMAIILLIFAAIGFGFFWLMDRRREIRFAPGQVPMLPGPVELILGNPGMICYTLFCAILVLAIILV